MEATAAAGDGIAEAAAALSAADWVLVAAGAGFSADSGLPTYEKCRAEGIDYDELCRAELAYEDPQKFCDFWVNCTRAYRKKGPHEGYKILDRLLRGRAEAGRVYIYTTNVDGHFRHLTGFPLCEIHGCCEEWMCSSTVPYAAVELLRDPQLAVVGSCGDTVPLQGERMTRVRNEQRRLLKLVQSTNGCEKPEIFIAPAVWPDQVTQATACGSTCSNEEQVHVHPSLLKCSCGLPLRPCVLMFADEDATLTRFLKKGQDEYQRWEDGMETQIASAGGRLVILEIGVGRRVEVVREECEWILRDVSAKGGEVTLIRIGPDADPAPSASSGAGADVATDSSSQQRLMCLRMTAQEALQDLENAMLSCT